MSLLTVSDKIRRSFDEKYLPEPNTGCWLWMMSTRPDGYGEFYTGVVKLTRLAHRVAYMMFVGPVPEGLDLDHLCRVRSCVNPAHLEPVTRRTNLLRGRGVTARNAAVTTCPAGHVYDEVNTYRYPKGSRYCRTCRRLGMRKKG